MFDASSYLLGKKNGGGSGTTNYNDLSNKPSINDVTLSGNKTSSDLGIQSEIDSTHKLDADLVDDSLSTNKFVSVTDKTTWNGKQDTLVSGTNIKTINNQSILGSGDITISGGGDGIKIFTTRDIDLRNDVEPGIYITDSDTNKMRIYDLEGTLNQISMGWGFFYVTKKYSEVAADEYFIYYHNPTGNNCRLQKTNDAKGINTSPTSGAGMWADRNNYLKKDNTTSFTPSGDYNPCTKLYTDKTHYENMAGYDATKTQVLKNINGTLTWVTEE